VMNAIWYNPLQRTHELSTTHISLSQVGQRAGRAARIMPGTYIGLYKSRLRDSFYATSIPAVFRQDLSTIMLTILSDNDDLFNFEWFHRPSAEYLECALEELRIIGAARIDVDAQGEASQNHIAGKMDVTNCEMKYRIMQFTVSCQIRECQIARIGTRDDLIEYPHVEGLTNCLSNGERQTVSTVDRDSK